MWSRVLFPLVFGVTGTAILLLLGFWQVQRLEWKTGILDSISSRLAAPAAAVPEAPDRAAHQYLRVSAKGVLGAEELHVYTSAPPRGVGYRVIAPLEAEDGRRILLDRGFVPIGEKDHDRLVGPISVEGALLWPQEADGWTSAPDLGENIWFARDAERMAEALGTEPVMVVVSASDDPAAPTPLPVGINIPNNHLEYALTWFGLAATWAGMTVYMLWRIKRRIE